jgi:hypothetical protein
LSEAHQRTDSYADAQHLRPEARADLIRRSYLFEAERDHEEVHSSGEEYDFRKYAQ